MRVVLGLSGGVDSSLAASLLTERGFDVVAVYLKFDRQAKRPDGGCAWQEDIAMCTRVAAQLDIPLVIRDVTERYESEVLTPMVDAYRHGETPNPDIACNRSVKFDELLAVARDVGARVIATGHYVRVRHIARGRVELFRGVDPVKDQSYFLWACSSVNLGATLFPVGGYTKDQVRAMARSRGLPNWDRPSTRGVCFLGGTDIATYLAERGEPQRADVRTTAGEAIGSVDVAQSYTVGQRIRVGGQPAARYVVTVDLRMRTLTVSDGPDDPARWQRVVRGRGGQWIGRVPSRWFACEARIRHRQQPQSCLVQVSGDDLTVTFDQPQLGVAPGQAIVLSEGDRVLGGAWIA